MASGWDEDEVPDLGARVRRGRDWADGDDSDGGAGGLGRVVDGPASAGWVRVLWDTGCEREYPWSGSRRVVAAAAADAPPPPPPAPPAVVPPPPLPGAVVVRGPDWRWGDQDGGAGRRGLVLPGCTVVGWVPVCWGDGGVQSYRWGADGGRFDLQLARASAGAGAGAGVDPSWCEVTRGLARPPAPGERVRRGPSWKWGDQDGGGARALGTAIGGVAPPGTLWVAWDAGGANLYRWGAEGGSRDVTTVPGAPPAQAPTPRVLPLAPSVGTRVRRGPDWRWGDQDGGRFGTVAEWRAQPGAVRVRWDAGGHGEYRWGLDGKQDVAAAPEAGPPPPPSPPRPLVPAPRPGAPVTRGPDWRWGDQNGGEGSRGVVVAGPRAPGWVRVRWADGAENLYRWGAEGGRRDLAVARERERESLASLLEKKRA